MIKLENVSYVYMQDGPFEKTALHDVSLEFADGEFIGVIGHTGSGKSTLIQMLNGLLLPTSGKITVNGHVLGAKETDMRKLRFEVGLVMQYPEYQLFEETVFKDIAFGPKIWDLPKRRSRNGYCLRPIWPGFPKSFWKSRPLICRAVKSAVLPLPVFWRCSLKF